MSIVSRASRRLPQTSLAWYEYPPLPLPVGPTGGEFFFEMRKRGTGATKLDRPNPLPKNAKDTDVIEPWHGDNSKKYGLSVPPSPWFNV